MKAIKVNPGKTAEIVDIDHSLKSLQTAVGGYIEAFYPFTDDVCIICNEEGKINGMPKNRIVRDDSGRIIDVIFGPFLVVGLTDAGCELCDLSDAQIEKYLPVFEQPDFVPYDLPRIQYAVIPCYAATGEWQDVDYFFTFCNSEKDALHIIQKHFDSGEWIAAQYMKYDSETDVYDPNVSYCYADGEYRPEEETV